MLAARHDDDEIYIYIYMIMNTAIYLFFVSALFFFLDVA